MSRCGCTETTGATPALSQFWTQKSVICEIKSMVLRHEFAGPVLSFSEPANSHLELTGLCLGNAGEKGWCLGA